MNMGKSFEDIRSGVVLAELGGHGDGPYCAKYGAGCALVVLGTYIVDPGRNVPYPKHFVFKPGRANYAGYLQEHVAAARKSGAKVGVSIISINPADSVDFLVAAEGAGADYASLCAHSEMEMFLNAGLGAALCRRENFASLRRWASAIVKAVKIPVIFKIGLDDTEETGEAVEVMAECGVPIVHVNVGSTDAGSEGLRALNYLAGKCEFLIGGGGVKDVRGARRALKTGADAVAIATAAMKDPNLCGRIQRELRQTI